MLTTMLSIRPMRIHQIFNNLLHSPLAKLFCCYALAFGLLSCTSPPANSIQPIDHAQAALPSGAPTLDDFWDQTAHFAVEIIDTGLPMGESDTVVMTDGTWRSYVHASHQSLGVLDQCGAPVEFPGCLVIFTSSDQGQTFAPMRNSEGVPICQIECTRCPCDSRRDHIDQQQYPRVDWLSTPTTIANTTTLTQNTQWVMTYEYRANTILRYSQDGLTWSAPAELPLTGIWQNWLMPCPAIAAIGDHPFTPTQYDCLVGSPPGIYIDTEASPPQQYVFVGLGQNPSAMGCYHGPLNAPLSLMRACANNPLFVGASEYGSTDTAPSATDNAHFDFRTISSADLLRVGERYYLFYEGVRGPGEGDQGDTQFLLGLARSKTSAIDGEWELYVNNPLLIDLPGNVGVGHADIVVANGETYLYTTLDGEKRSRLRLIWN